ncbi:MAG: substrate-binding domain-containing protein [Flavobacteriales bacterium]|nr:substrate-binding domain-containing protein [Flavobacteriales bacterium]
MKTKFLFVSIVFSMFGLFSCGQQVKEDYTDTLTSGETTIAFDDSYSFLFETIIRVFENLNPEAKIQTMIKNENEAINCLLKDSCKVIVLNRDLTKKEYKTFEANNLFPKSVKFAYDAVALIVHPENPDSIMDVEDLKSILTGKITKWNELGPYDNSEILVVFDKPNSANFNYMKDSLLKGESLQKNCFGMNSNKEVIEYIKNNKKAIGIISAGWITDDYSNLAKAFLNSVKVVGVGHKSSGKYYKPYQYYIKENDYPFIRSLYLINRQTRMGLGTGFVNYVCKQDKGQLIITKSGLVPVYLYIRDVKANVE